MSLARFAILLFLSSLLVAQKPGWQPSFTDDFEAPELNLTRWTPRDPLRPVASSSPANLPVSGGSLHMTGPSAISTFGLFAQPYGRFEIRFRSGSDTRARFRLLPVPPAPLPAITVFEVTGELNKISVAHSWGSPQTERTYGDVFPVPDLTARFHTVTVVWERDRIAWTLDGKEELVSTEGVSSLPAFLLIDLASGTLDIDYIRVWHHPDRAEPDPLE